MSISFVIPTYNSQKYILKCLNSIYSSICYSFEVLIIDGGSIDNTLNLIMEFDPKIKIFSNKYKTAEAGKLIGINNAKCDFICLLDSDNELEKNYIDIAIKELSLNSSIMGAEPIKFSYRPSDGIIDRFSSIYGVNDPLNIYLGNFDKYSDFHKDWTKAKYSIINENSNYITIKLFDKKIIPTIGANGTILRRKPLVDFIKNKDYFFDVDYIVHRINTKGECLFIKVKKGIIHYYCVDDFRNFYKKQSRRIKDFYYFKDLRVPNKQKYTLEKIFFVLNVIFPIFMIYKSCKIFIKRKDVASLLLFPLSIITLYVYVIYSLKFLLFGNSSFKRN